MEAVRDMGGTRVSLELVNSQATGDSRDPAAGTNRVEADETTLVEQAVSGDVDAFAALYERHVDRVFRHCYYYMGNRTDAEDVAQQTFLRAWEAIGRYRQTGAPILAWLLTIASRTAISQLRRSRELATVADPPEKSGGGDPQEIVVSLDSCDMVRRAVLQLNPDRQQVIVLRFIEGLSIAEVAAVLGKTENNVSVVQHRALKDLRYRLTTKHASGNYRSRAIRALRDVVVRVGSYA
jgi:RNA polymerase sigma-70 factor (ECF subfamily)